MVEMAQNMPSICKDFVAVQISPQVNTLQRISRNLEESYDTDKGLAEEPLKQAVVQFTEYQEAVC